MARVRDKEAAVLYDRDFYEWTRKNAELLRQGRFDDADIENIATEIEDMGKGEKRELRSRMTVLLGHLLKWQFQPERRSRSWRETITTQRVEIASLLHLNPSLRPVLRNELVDYYTDAVDIAVSESGLPLSAFPHTCPYLAEEIMSRSFLPGEQGPA
jgi:hypothetical protein